MGIAAAVGALASKGAVALFGVAKTGLFAKAAGFIGSSLGSLATSFVVNSALGAILGKKKPKLDFGSMLDRTQTVTQSASHRHVVYGKVRKGGTLFFLHNPSGAGSEWLHACIALADHECQAIDKVYMDIPEQYTNDGEVELTGNQATNTNVAGAFQMYTKLGTADQTAISTLITDCSDVIDSNFRARGTTYAYLKLKFNGDIYPNGISHVQSANFLVRGAKLFDTRTSTTAYSNNSALVLYDFLTNSVYGLGIPSADIDTDSFDTAADVCDEDVNLNGGGTEKRYTCNGVVTSDQDPEEVIQQILGTMSGKLVRTGGTWKVFAGEYRSPTVTLTEDNLRGDINVQVKTSYKDLFNGVKGVYITEKNDYLPTDYPAVQNSTYVTEDGGEELWLDLPLPFTNKSGRAQRLAKIRLEQNRQQLTCTYPCDLKGMQLEVGDTVQVTDDDFGWSAKVFDVETWALVVRQDQNNQPYLGVDLGLRETNSTVYDWDESTEETTTTDAPNTTLPNANVVSAPSGLTLASGTDQLFTKADGTVVSRLKVSWDAVTDSYVSNNGRIEIQYKRSTDTVYQKVFTDGSDEQVWITPVEDGVSYDVRIRAINAIGMRSAFTTSTHTIVGKTAEPANVTVFYAAQVDNAISFNWNQVDEADLAGYEIRYGERGAITWTDGKVITREKKGTHTVALNVPPGTWTFMIKAIDTSGNYSKRAAATNLIVANNNTIIEYQENELFQTGTLLNFVRHHTEVLYPQSQTLASDLGDELWNATVQNPYQTCKYTGTEVDLGQDYTVRVWSDIDGGLFPAETSGVFSPRFQLFHRVDGSDAGLFESETNNLLTPSNLTLTNCIVHHTGVLVPKSQSLASDLDWEVFDEFVPNPYTTFTAEIPEVDMTADRTVTVSIDTTTEAGPGETNFDDVTASIDYKTSVGSYDGFEDLTGDLQINARYIKQKITGSTNNGVPKVTLFQTTFDPFIDWALGEFTGRYFTVRMVMDTVEEGIGKITNLQTTADR